MAQANDWLRYRASSLGLDWAEASFRDLHFSPHRHDTYAVGLTTRGVQAFTYRGASRASCPGEVFVLHPDELHDGRPGGEDGFGYRIVYVDPALIASALGGGPLPFVADPVCRSKAMKAAVRAIFPKPVDPRDDLRENDVVTALAAALSRAARQPTRPRTLLSSATRRLREHLAATPERRFSMADLEREHGLDRFTLARQFRRAFGVSPSRFVTLRRLEMVQRLMSQGRSLAEAAVVAGFADQAHMTRQFRAAYGTTPGRWRALLRAAEGPCPTQWTR